MGIEHQPGIRLGLQVIRHDNFPFSFGGVLSNWQDDLLPEKQCSAMFCLYRVNSTTASIKTFESCTMYTTILFYSISWWSSKSISLDSAPLPHGSPGPMCFCHQRLRPEAILEKLGDERGTVSRGVMQRAFGRTCFSWLMMS